MISNKVIFFTDHSTIKYLLRKKDAKPRLIRWVILMQEFNVEIKDKNGSKNLEVDHLSRLELPDHEASQVHINDSFPDEQFLAFVPYRLDSMVCGHRELSSCLNHLFHNVWSKTPHSSCLSSTM